MPARAVPAIKAPGKGIVRPSHERPQHGELSQPCEPALTGRMRPETSERFCSHVELPVSVPDVEALPHLFQRDAHLRYGFRMRVHIDPLDIPDTACLHPPALTLDTCLANRAGAIVINLADLAGHCQ